MSEALKYVVDLAQKIIDTDPECIHSNHVRKAGWVCINLEKLMEGQEIIRDGTSSLTDDDRNIFTMLWNVDESQGDFIRLEKGVLKVKIRAVEKSHLEGWKKALRGYIRGYRAACGLSKVCWVDNSIYLDPYKTEEDLKAKNPSLYHILKSLFPEVGFSTDPKQPFVTLSVSTHDFIKKVAKYLQESEPLMKRIKIR
jgi:hypothetical protein